MIKAIKFASVPVRDQDRALAFYTQTLGFRVVTDQAFDGAQRWIELALPRGETRLVLFTPKGHESHIGQFSHVTFTADDVEVTARELTAKGVEFVQQPQKAGWGHRRDLQGSRRQSVRRVFQVILTGLPIPLPARHAIPARHGRNAG